MASPRFTSGCCHLHGHQCDYQHFQYFRGNACLLRRQRHHHQHPHRSGIDAIINVTGSGSIALPNVTASTLEPRLDTLWNLDGFSTITASSLLRLGPRPRAMTLTFNTGTFNGTLVASSAHQAGEQFNSCTPSPLTLTPQDRATRSLRPEPKPPSPSSPPAPLPSFDAVATPDRSRSTTCFTKKTSPAARFSSF